MWDPEKLLWKPEFNFDHGIRQIIHFLGESIYLLRPIELSTMLDFYLNCQIWSLLAIHTFENAKYWKYCRTTKETKYGFNFIKIVIYRKL